MEINCNFMCLFFLAHQFCIDRRLTVSVGRYSTIWSEEEPPVYRGQSYGSDLILGGHVLGVSLTGQSPPSSPIEHGAFGRREKPDPSAAPPPTPTPILLQYRQLPQAANKNALCPGKIFLLRRMAVIEDGTTLGCAIVVPCRKGPT